MPLYYVGVFYHTSVTTGDKPLLFSEATHLTDFSYFTRSTILEHLRFASRTIVDRTPVGTTQSVSTEKEGLSSFIHVSVRTNGISCVVITDLKYPQYVAHSLIRKTLESLQDTMFKNGVSLVSKDQNNIKNYPWMMVDIEKYQKPADVEKLIQVKNKIEDIKDIMRVNIDELLKRGETLESVMMKSDELSKGSIKFYDKARKVNSCCKY